MSPRWLIAGMSHGAAVWGAYAVAEYVLGSWYPFVTKPHLTITPTFVGWTLAIACIYLLLGGLLGLATALLLSRLENSEPRHVLQPAMVLTPLIALICNLAFRYPLSGYEMIAIAIGCVLAAVQIRRMLQTPRSSLEQLLSGPWTTILAVLMVPWLSREVLEFHPPWEILAASAGAGVLLLLASWVADRIRLPRESAISTMAVVLLLVLVCGIHGVVANRALPTRLADAAPAADGTRPNIVLISMDTVRADHLSVYGYARETTPNLKKLAADSTLFRRAFAAADMTLPSHASMFTGQYARAHGAHYFPPDLPDGRPIPAQFPVLAEILGARGYVTLGLVANTAYLSPEWGFARGFQLYDRRAPVPIHNYKRRFYLRAALRSVLNRFTSTAEFDRLTLRAEDLTAEAVAALDREAGKGRPIFLFLNYMDAHVPYVPPARFDRFAPSGRPAMDLETYRVLENGILERKRQITTSEEEEIIAHYDGGIASVDAAIGELLLWLRNRGQYDSMMIVVTSDHGEAFGERSLIGHGGLSVYQDQVRVPLLIKYPGEAQGGQTQVAASHVDILPTILQAARIETPPGLHGRSLLKPATERPLVSESFPGEFYLPFGRQFNRIERAVIEGDKKLIVSTLGKTELYDLASDPEETRNLYREHDPVGLTMRSHLAEWLKAVPPNRGGGAKPSKATLDNLKSLGYVQ